MPRTSAVERKFLDFMEHPLLRKHDVPPERGAFRGSLLRGKGSGHPLSCALWHRGVFFSSMAQGVPALTSWEKSACLKRYLRRTSASRRTLNLYGYPMYATPAAQDGAPPRRSVDPRRLRERMVRTLQQKGI